MLTEHKEVCLSINGAQSVRFEKGTIEFKNYFKQIPVSFKAFVDFEYSLEGVESYEGSYWNKYQDHIPCSFACKRICVDDKFTKPIFVFRDENSAYEFIKEVLKEYEFCKKVMKNNSTKIWSWVKKKNNFNQVKHVGYGKNSLTMTIIKLEVIVT